MAGKGISISNYDTCPRLPSDGNGDWYDAFHALDDAGDKTALLSLLRSRKRMDSIVRHHLADLIERYELGKPHGRPRTPSYIVSEREYHIALAVEDVWSMVRHPKNPIPYEEALARVAKNYRIVRDTLDNACQGRRASARRQRKRRTS